MNNFTFNSLQLVLRIFLYKSTENSKGDRAEDFKFGPFPDIQF